jgi:hypothetical protein
MQGAICSMSKASVPTKIQALEGHWYCTASVHRARKIENQTQEIRNFKPWPIKENIFDLSTYGIDTKNSPSSNDLYKCQLSALFHHLRYTTCLEQILVLPALQDIALERIINFKSDDLSRFAFKLITDEAFHSQYTEDISHLVSSKFQLNNPFPLHEIQDSISCRIASVGSKVNDSLSSTLVRFCCAYVTETSITGVLRKNSEFVTNPVIRGYFKDHLQDELIHSHFFRECMSRLWHQLSSDKRTKVSAVVEEAVNLFLSVDTSAIFRLSGHPKSLESDLKTLDFKDLMELNSKDTIYHFQALRMPNC